VDRVTEGASRGIRRPTEPSVEIVRSINSSLCRLLPTGAFFTLLYARLNHKTGVCRWSMRAIHRRLWFTLMARYRLLCGRKATWWRLRDAVFGTNELTLQRGDRIFFIQTTGRSQRFYEEGLTRLSGACTHGDCYRCASLYQQLWMR